MLGRAWKRQMAGSLIGIVAMALAVPSSVATADVLETFDTDPIAGGRAAVVGSNQSTDTAGAPAVPFLVSTPGILTHNLNSNWRTAGAGIPDTSQHIADASRLHIPLGKTYTQDDSFSFGATMRVLSGGFWAPGAFMQIDFGLVNSVTTGFDRTGDAWPWTKFGDAYDGLEWNFFPDDGWTGATVQSVFLGTQNAATQLWDRMAASFGANLATPPPYGLPLDTWMDITVTYDAPSRTASVTVADSISGMPYVDHVTVPDVVLPALWADSTPAGFDVDTLAIMNYQDGAAALSPSLVAEVEYETVWFSETAPPIGEPAACATLVLGLFGLAGSRRRRA